MRGWRGTVHQQEDDAVQGEEGIARHEKGEDLEKYSVGRVQEDFDRDNAADEEETDGDDIDEGSGAIVRKDKVGGQDRGDSGKGLRVTHLTSTFEEVNNPRVEEDKCVEKEGMGDNDGEEDRNGVGQ